MYAQQDRKISKKNSQTNSKLAGDNPVVQRAVGFEFGYCPWILFKTVEKHPHETDAEILAKQMYKKGDCVHEAEFWKTTADTFSTRESYVEIITKPFEEDENGLVQLSNVMDQIEEFLNAVLQTESKPMIGENAVALKNVPIKTGHLIDQQANVLFRDKALPTCVPQATAGIRLDKLTDLYFHLGQHEPGDPDFVKEKKKPGLMALMRDKGDNSEKASHAFILRKIADIAFELARMLETIINEPVSSTFIGFVSLVLTYLICGNSGSEIYAKGFTSLLARTDFATMFKMLPEVEQQVLKENDGELWLEMIENTLPQDQRRLDMPFFTRGIFRKEKPIFHQILKDLSKRKWLVGMTEGVDYLTERHFPNRFRAYELESLGAMGEQVDMVQGLPAPIIEFRGCQGRINMQQTRDFAINTLKFVRSLHDGAGTFWGE
ncbi:hypothetical protein [Aureibacter tunicatorum]|uniref:Uncharacterized protein n=1 Tax=Aureibacter tunicatorum TaxID=866807 RepID=A0AAE3XLL6_9BACT|nr:hypothetical protein [Aureibacter tunicatorum]MDR6238268.1 hypothetical protein [Aureibacter tunicatorum]BDD03301.1 hypothetical protein AUTU_07840 [Aureibacter tunicatorum]